jgi:hypothetical protein
MPKSKRASKKPQDKEKSQEDRAPYQKNSDRNAVKSAEETRHVPTQHGAIK